MKEKLIELNLLRKNVEVLKNEFSLKQDEFNKENEILMDKIRDLGEKMDSVSAGIRILVIEQYDLTGNKTQEFGLGIRVTKKLSYDAKEALNFAKEHKMFLKLDKTGFEKHAKLEDVSFVKIEEVPTATIPTNLDKQLKGEL